MPSQPSQQTFSGNGFSYQNPWRVDVSVETVPGGPGFHSGFYLANTAEALQSHPDPCPRRRLQEGSSLSEGQVPSWFWAALNLCLCQWEMLMLSWIIHSCSTVVLLCPHSGQYLRYRKGTFSFNNGLRWKISAGNQLVTCLCQERLGKCK